VVTFAQPSPVRSKPRWAQLGAVSPPAPRRSNVIVVPAQPPGAAEEIVLPPTRTGDLRSLIPILVMTRRSEKANSPVSPILESRTVSPVGLKMRLSVRDTTLV